MSSRLAEIESFRSDDDLRKTQVHIAEMVQSGELTARGLDAEERSRFVEIYETADGEMWHLALPDHAFRGYLKRK